MNNENHYNETIFKPVINDWILHQLMFNNGKLNTLNDFILLFNGLEFTEIRGC